MQTAQAFSASAPAAAFSGLQAEQPDRFIRIEEVSRMTTLKRSSIYRRIAEVPPAFPKPVKLGGRTVAWSLAAVQAWMDACTTDHTVKG